MKLGSVILGFSAAIVAHGLVLTFGGWFFLHDEKKPENTSIELVAPEEAVKPKDKEKEKPPDPVEKKEELKSEDEPPPDAAEILKSLELSAAAAAPKLDAASLSDIEQALNGGGGSGDFGSALSFNSGGMIGGTGSAGALDKKMESAFSLDEIDQKPRVLVQTQPVTPSEMRGKKIEGEVTVIFVVDETGRVTSVKALKSNNTAFEKPALDAVKQWKFEPALKGGQRVPWKQKISIRFPAS
jgi:periplasmic protein TonB